MPQLCTLGEWLQVQTVGGGPSAGDPWGLETRGRLHGQPQARDALPTAQPIQISDRETAASRWLGSKSCFEGVGDLLMSAA